MLGTNTYRGGCRQVSHTFLAVGTCQGPGGLLQPPGEGGPFEPVPHLPLSGLGFGLCKPLSLRHLYPFEVQCV